MKKLLTILALVLTVALCASFAASADTLDISNVSSASKDVTLTYDALVEDTDTTVYSVDVTWTDVAFSYDAGTTQWNPEKHDYSAVGDAAAWTDGEGSVTVTNHSNAEVLVQVTFAKADTPNGTADIAVTGGSFTLDSAVDVAVDAADSQVATLAASGVPADASTIGTVTVSIQKIN